MGCVCGKPSSATDDSPKQRELIRKTSELCTARAVSREKNDSFSVKERLEKGDIKIGLIDRSNVSSRVRDDYYDKRREKDCDDISSFPSMGGSLPKAMEGEQVAAGWPSWLVAVAGEAIRGWVPRKAETFEKLDKIGQGTYSSVYKGRDLVQNKAVALKKVSFDNMDPESVKFMAREILILRRLDHPNVIKLEGLVTSKTSCSLYLVFEYMEHDLTGLASVPGVKFTESQVKCYMQQLLSGLDHCHSNGVLHRDIKGSNLLINNRGNLKIADFGLASYFDNNRKIPLTSRVVTLWYRPPELLLGSTQYGVAVDLWSAGCILGELYAGKPIMRGRTEVEQLHKIFKLCGSPSEDYWRKSKLPHSPVFKPIQPYRPQIAETFKNLPETAVRLMESLLSINPSERGTTSFALQSEFFKTEPYACDPSSLPKYPPSKEIDAKLREEQACRRGAVGVKGYKCEYDSKRSKESLSAAAPAANAVLSRLMQRHGNVNLKCQSELFDPQKDGPAPGLNRLHSNDPGLNHRDPASDSGPIAPRAGWMQPVRKNIGASFPSSRNDSSGQAGPTASTRGLSPVVSREEEIATSCVGPTDRESFGELSVGKQEGRRRPQVFRGSLNEEKMGKRELDTDGHEQEMTTHFSGPLLSTSKNIEQMLKEHDRRVQEAARRVRNEKKRVGGIIRAH